MADLAKAYVQIIPSAEGITEGLEKALGEGADSAGRSAGSKIAAGVGAALVAGTAAVAGFAATSVQAGKSFDASMSQVAATMGLTTDQIGDLRDFALEMGSSTAFSASEAADALNYMALAGYSADEAMTALPNVLNLAAAGGIDLASASDMVTDAQSALGMSFEQTAGLVDQMAMAASKSNTSVAQLGDAILTVGGTAKNLAGGTTELATSLGILADNGIKGAEGGTSLRNMILSLTAPTDKAADMMEDLGVAVFDSEGNMRSLNDIFGDLNASMADMTQEQRMNALSTIFNNRDLKSAEAMLANVGDRWDELSGYIDNAQGAAQRMADTQLDNLAGDVTMFKSALEGAQIVVSDALTPSLRDMVQFGTSGIQQVAQAFKEGGLSGAAEALGDVISQAVTGITQALPSLASAGAQLTIAAATGILQNAPQMVTAAAQIVTSLLDGLSQALPTLIPVAAEAVLGIVQALIENAPQMLEAALSLIEALGNGLIQALPTLIARLPEIVTGIVDFLVSAIPMIAETGVTLLSALVEALPEIIAAIVEALPAIIEGIVSGLLESITLLIEAGITLFSALVENLPEIIAAIVEALPEIIDGIINALLDPENLSLMINAGIRLFVALIENTPEIIRQLVEALPDIIMALVNGIVEFHDEFNEAGYQLFNGLWEGMKSIWPSIEAWILEIMGFTTEQINMVLGIHSPSTVFAEIGRNMALGIGVGFEDTMDDVDRDMQRALMSTTAALDRNADAAFGGGIASPEYFNVTIDAGSVKEFNDIVNLARNARRLGRMATA